MTKCWGCQRPIEEHFRTCTHCGAAVAAAKKPDAASALEPPPIAAAGPSAGRPTRARIQFVLNPQPAGTATGLPGGVQVESPPKQLSDHIRGLRDAMRDNAQATLAIAILLGCVIYGAAVGTHEAYLSGLYNAPTPDMSADQGLYVRDLGPSFRQINFCGASIKVVDVWVAKLGQYDQMALTPTITPTDTQRLYLQLAITGNAKAVGLFVGDPLEPMQTLTVQQKGQPVTLHYLDLAPFDTRPQVVVIRNPTDPKSGSLKLLLQ